MYDTPFSVSTARVGDGRGVVSVSGELDLHTVGQLKQELDAAASLADRVVLDLARVTFMDSTALGAIVVAHRRLRGAGGDLTLVSDDPRTVRLFAITGLDRLLRIHPSLGDAIDSLVAVPAAT